MKNIMRVAWETLASQMLESICLVPIFCLCVSGLLFHCISVSGVCQRPTFFNTELLSVMLVLGL